MSSRIKKRTAEQQAKYDEWLARYKAEKAIVSEPSPARQDAPPPLPPDTVRIMARLERAEQALREIEGIACEAIYNTGIMKEPPRDKWVRWSDLILGICAPIRDKARAATRHD